MQNIIEQAKVFLNDIGLESDFIIEIDNSETCINIMEESDYGIEFAEQVDNPNDIQKLYEYLDSNNIQYHVREID